MRVPGYEADRYRIVLRAWPDGPEHVLTEAWDRSPGSLVWARDGKTIYATADNLGQTALFAVDVTTGTAKAVVGQGTVRSPSIAGDRLVFGSESLLGPLELYSVRPDGSDRRAVTRINADKLATVRLGEPGQFEFKGWNGETVHGYVVKPADFDPSKRYPVAFLIHGGPQGSFGNDFHYRWNPQIYAGAGYAAARFDPQFKMDLMPLLRLADLMAGRIKRAVKLLVAGSSGDGDYLRFMRDQARAEGVEATVEFVPDPDEPRKLHLFRAADAFLSLSDNIQETFGLTPIEAMAAGVPVVDSDWDGYRSLIEDGVSGFLVPTRTLAPVESWEAANRAPVVCGPSARAWPLPPMSSWPSLVGGRCSAGRGGATRSRSPTGWGRGSSFRRSR